MHVLFSMLSLQEQRIMKNTSVKNGKNNQKHTPIIILPTGKKNSVKNTAMISNLILTSKNPFLSTNGLTCKDGQERGGFLEKQCEICNGEGVIEVFTDFDDCEEVPCECTINCEIDYRE